MMALPTCMSAKKKKSNPERDSKGHFLKGHHIKRGPRGKQTNPCPNNPAQANLKPIKYGELKLDEEMLGALEEIAAPNQETPSQLFVSALQRGLPIQMAVERMGVSRTTWSTWIARAEAGEQIPLLDRFLVLARMVRAENYAWHMENIRLNASGERKGFFPASAWTLERLEQDTFALKTRPPQEITVNIKNIVAEAESAAQDYAKLVAEQAIDVEPLQIEAPDDAE
jgi:predicted transcriptional regulator